MEFIHRYSLSLSVDALLQLGDDEDFTVGGSWEAVVAAAVPFLDTDDDIEVELTEVVTLDDNDCTSETGGCFADPQVDGSLPTPGGAAADDGASLN